MQPGALRVGRAPRRVSNQQHRGASQGCIVPVAEARHNGGSGLPQHDVLERLGPARPEREPLRCRCNVVRRVDIEHEGHPDPDIAELEAAVPVGDPLRIECHGPRRLARLSATDPERGTRHAVPAGVDHPALDGLPRGQSEMEGEVTRCSGWDLLLFGGVARCPGMDHEAPGGVGPDPERAGPADRVMAHDKWRPFLDHRDGPADVPAVAVPQSADEIDRESRGFQQQFPEQ